MSASRHEWTKDRTKTGIVLERLATDSDESRQWIIFVHGVGLHRQVWRPWAESLAADFNLASFDIPGYGESQLHDALPRSMDAWASYIEVVQDHIGVDNSIVVGESLGGTSSLYFAIKHPNRVSALILCSTGFRGSLIPEVVSWREIFDKSGSIGWSEYMNKRRFNSDDSSWAIGESAQAQMQCEPEVVTSDGEMLLRADLEPYLKSVSQPVLLIQPGSSPFISREHSYLFEQSLPGCSLVLIGPSRHGVALAYGRESAGFARLFLKRHGLVNTSEV